MSETTAEPEAWDADIALPAPRSNRPLTLLKRIEAAFFLGLMGILKHVPIERASNVMGRVMRAIGPMIRTVHKRGEANLRLIYPDMTPAERSAILADTWENIGRTAAEYSHLGALAERTTVENGHIFQSVAEGRTKAIFISGHFANWEVMGATMKAAGVKLAFVYRAPNNTLVDQYIIHQRAAHISRYQIPKGKRGGRDLIKALKDGYSLSM
ncbi:MAG: hypothetical protein AAF788_06640, partial [Pseudomonadota bacterium]